MWRAWNAAGHRHRHRRLGAVGSVAVAAGGWTAGTLPARDPWGLWVPHGTAVTVAGAALAYAGLTLLIAAWWGYRRAARGASARDTLVTLGWWGAPLLLAPPLYSADVYSYIAQGAMVLEGHDVYGAGPAVLDPGGRGGDAAASVGGHWTDTPAPYGPVFLLVAQAVTWVTGGTIVPAVLGMRLVAVAAVGLTVWALRRLARASDTDEGSALWIGALNPLLLIHVVGGMHNDGLMIALMLSGVALALRGRWIAGSALVGLAAMVKSPAAVALLFIGVIVVRAATGEGAGGVRRGGRARGAGVVGVVGRGDRVRLLAKGLLGPGLVAASVAVAATLVAGTGFGWLGTQSVAGTIHTALSATSDLGLALGELLHLLFGTDPDPVKAAVQRLGLVAALVVIVVLARRAARGVVAPAPASAPARVTALDPVHALGLALLALVALSPMVQPWYALWGMTLIAATAPHGRAARVVMVLSAALPYETQPSGHTPAYGFVLAGVACVIGTVLLRREAAPPAPAASLPRLTP
ncbi:polyprenol phosphomannose-dependent alpha 1,6 mannosyltransferase MptB [Streptomyces sp. NPDC006368]|uniref:polyprenol phosphomannose-dependent alpha 1,6 mannosyltransferase MptB n=1 Tax=Streptomyces sp. NPDC006368 TaxID=3156760 RepID=UPI0033A36A09